MAFLNETGLTRYDGKLKNLMAAAYSTSATYAVGDYCIHGGSLYRCTAAIESAEAWTAAHWTKVNLGDEIDSAKEDIAKLKLDVADAFSAADSHEVGDYVVKDGVLYRCTTAIGSGGETWTPGHWTAVNIGDELVAVKADIGILKSDLADAYDSTATYEVGDYCLKDGVLYRCTTAISTAEAWTAGHWTAVQVGDDLSELKGAINDLTNYTHNVSTFKIATNNTTNIESGQITSAICGNLITISGQIKTVSDGVGAWLQTLCTLDTDTRPSAGRIVWAYATYDGTPQFISLELLTDGTLRTRITSSSGHQLAGNAWITIPNQFVFT